VGEDRTGEPQANHDRLTVAQAAKALGITEGAVRSRIKRGTLPSTKEGGTVFVRWGGGTSQANQTPNTGVPGDQSELIEALRDQIEVLRQERDEWREQARITDRLLSAAMERIPAIEAPPEPSEDAETVEEAPDRAEPRSATVEAQEELSAERARREKAETTLHEGMTEERRRREAAERERDELRRELVGLGRRTEAHEAAEGQQGRGQPQSAAGGAQEGARRPWWRRVFGG
jgi:predicted flap endonuclease-1-like 5' DNA nuclease